MPRTFATPEAIVSRQSKNFGYYETPYVDLEMSYFGPIGFMRFKHRGGFPRSQLLLDAALQYIYQNLTSIMNRFVLLST